jgi:uncharacterized protein
MSHSLNVINDGEPWYADGLRFKCTECGQCCTGSPGYTWVSVKEVEEISEHLKIPIADFARKYLRIVDGKIALLEDPVNYDCIFLRDKKCSIYAIRPKQCRTFPWWPKNLKSKADWQEAARYCEGISMDAPVVAVGIIQEQLSIQMGD